MIANVEDSSMSTDSMDLTRNWPGPAVPGSLGEGPSPGSASSLATRYIEEMVAAWRRGERPRVEEILARHTDLGDDAVIRLIYEELCLRREAGLEVDSAEIARQFPRWREELTALLDCQRLMELAPTRVLFPEVGDVLAGFRLLAELGRGAAGQVFLAAQHSLGDRPVVLKVTPRGRDEHLSLARLQHMNIVPLYSQHVHFDRNLQALCMPFLGGTTLARILTELRDQPLCRRTGRQVVEALDRLQVHRTDGPMMTGPFRGFLARATYVEAICSIGAAIADGLQYAHERGLVHMDVKPSNVLLAGDGQPMLLDFHLARSPIDPRQPPPEWVGGTLGFMSPEHRRAIAALGEGRPIRDAVDGRADIYSLGMLLYVALGGGTSKSDDAPLLPLHRRNPRVSVGLSDIIHKCLRGDQNDRYADAAALASDLRRHLADLPLRGVPNRSWAERWRKWRRRHPSALSRLGLIGLVLFAAVGAPAATLGIAYRQRRDAVAVALYQGRAAFERRQYAEANAALRQGLAVIDGLPGFDRQRRELAGALELATRAGRIAGLHELAETIRFRYGLSPPPAEEAPALLRLGRKTWEGLDSLLRGLDGVGAPEIDGQVRTDLRDLVLLWADLRVRYAPANERDQASREAVGILTEAAALIGTSPSLERDRRAYSRGAGPDDGSDRFDQEAHSAWEHYDLGKSYLRSGKLELAAEQFRRGLKLRPQDFWLNFYDGLCGYRLGHLDGAVNAFRVCIALAPATAECYYNRALAYQALGQLDLAADDYDRALELAPRLTDALLNRAINHFRRGHHDTAIADLERALGTTSNRGILGIIHYNLALVHQARGEGRAAAENARAGMRFGNPDARELGRRLEQAAGPE
jgi:serine/threonine protein kinase/Flp pilus assembly protein TadD